MIGGNVIATVQVKTGTGKNAIGETVQEWKDLGNLLGFLDNQTSDINLQEYNALIQETTDIFICDYKRLNGMHFNAENARFIIWNIKTIVFGSLMKDMQNSLDKQVMM